MATWSGPPKTPGASGLPIPELGARRDVVIVDLQVPIRRGVDLVRQISETCPNAIIMARVRLRSGKSASFQLEIRDGALRLSPGTTHPTPV